MAYRTENAAPWSLNASLFEVLDMYLNIYRLFIRFRGRIFTSCCRATFHRVGQRSTLLPPLRVGGETFIDIGNRVFIGPDCWIQVMQDHVQKSAPVIVIGDETSIVGACTITAVQSVVIEPRVLIARNVYISDHTHAHRSRDNAIKNQGFTKISPVRICEGAWLGQNAVICPGVTIGRNAVVGANSVVRQDVSDFSVVAGIPAKFIRKVDQ